jgi:hypothetical protein
MLEVVKEADRVQRAKGSWAKIALITVLACCCLGVVYGFLEAFWFMPIYYVLFGLPLFVSRVLVLYFLRPRKNWQIFGLCCKNRFWHKFGDRK